VQAVKIIFKYMEGTLDFVLWYPTCTNFTFTTYTYAYWVGSVDDKKSTNGGEIFLGNNLVFWFNKKQSSIYLSTTEVEYIATTTCNTQIL
jgi:hypothetical protein